MLQKRKRGKQPARAALPDLRGASADRVSMVEDPCPITATNACMRRQPTTNNENRSRLSGLARRCQPGRRAAAQGPRAPRCITAYRRHYAMMRRRACRTIGQRMRPTRRNRTHLLPPTPPRHRVAPAPRASPVIAWVRASACRTAGRCRYPAGPDRDAVPARLDPARRRTALHAPPVRRQLRPAGGASGVGGGLERRLTRSGPTGRAGPAGP